MSRRPQSAKCGLVAAGPPYGTIGSTLPVPESDGGSRPGPLLSLALFGYSGLMESTRRTLVDFVARGQSDDEWLLVLVEEGPWTSAIEDRLRSIQERLYGCVDAALDGDLAQKFPDTNGKRIIVRLDCYDGPAAEVSEFFSKFADGIFRIPDYAQALANTPHAREIAFELNLETLE